MGASNAGQSAERDTAAATNPPIAMRGGNLLSNGRGLYVTTQRVLWQNASRGCDAAGVLEGYFGAKQVVILDELSGEPNGHVDIFATFTSPDTIVVGRYSPEHDPINAAILDRNADRLSQVKTESGPLRVVRVPMPPSVLRPDGAACWPTYTNVVYANGALLVPVYPGFDPAGERRALDTYRQLLPGWKIVGVDFTSLMLVQGGPHCAAMNLWSTGGKRNEGAIDRERPSPPTE